VCYYSQNFDGFVKSPSAAMRFSVFARLASGAFYKTILEATFFREDHSLMGNAAGRDYAPQGI
jgi:hypothetical protein